MLSWASADLHFFAVFCGFLSLFSANFREKRTERFSPQPAPAEPKAEPGRSPRRGKLRARRKENDEGPSFAEATAGRRRKGTAFTAAQRAPFFYMGRTQRLALSLSKGRRERQRWGKSNGAARP